MGETTKSERDELRFLHDDKEPEWSCYASVGELLKLLNDADRLAAIERDLRELADELKRTGEEGGLYEDPDEACACIAIELRAILDPEGT